MAVIHKRYFNRELSWLEFNLRVLEEAMDETHPLLERVKFFSIFHTNMDEFFMIRVSGLIEQVESGLLEQSPDGLTAREQIEAIRERVIQLRDCARKVYENDLLPQLAREGIKICRYEELAPKQK